MITINYYNTIYQRLFLFFRCTTTIVFQILFPWGLAIFQILRVDSMITLEFYQGYFHSWSHTDSVWKWKEKLPNLN